MKKLLEEEVGFPTCTRLVPRSGKPVEPRGICAFYSSDSTDIVPLVQIPEEPFDTEMDEAEKVHPLDKRQNREKKARSLPSIARETLGL